MNVRRARDDVRVTRAFLLQLGDPPTGLTDDERAGHPVPWHVDRLEVGIESPRADPRQIECGRTVATQVADLSQHAGEDARLLFPILSDVGKARRYQSAP